MADLSTIYAGLKLKNPIIAGSSGLTGTVESIKKIAENGAGAIVLKSIFEEEITNEYEKVLESAGASYYEMEYLDYFDYKIKSDNINKYLKLITEAKAAVSIPVIASINCVSSHEWTYFAKKIEEAGADAIELNIFITASDITKTSDDIENMYFEIIDKITQKVSIPVTLKLSSHFTDLTNFIKIISETKIKGLVLFNKFFSPDIDIEKRKIVSGPVFSSPEDISKSLRWVAISSNNVSCSLAASTGIHNGEGVIKQILAGADAVQIVSTIYKNGAEIIPEMIKDLEEFMKRYNYSKISDFKGEMSNKNLKDVHLYERMQFMRYFSDKDIL
jgi:dihydroorotate dehydrogenase (fumarate)